MSRRLILETRMAFVPDHGGMYVERRLAADYDRHEPWYRTFLALSFFARMATSLDAGGLGEGSHMWTRAMRERWIPEGEAYPLLDGAELGTADAMTASLKRGWRMKSVNFPATVVGLKGARSRNGDFARGAAYGLLVADTEWTMPAMTWMARIAADEGLAGRAPGRTDAWRLPSLALAGLAFDGLMAPPEPLDG